ncbi:helix-turn-helix domain-containing protein [uncultured Fusobacterium sp.]|uniref:helix-turn-helix domain-containing protein n=1 Tax=uncultured Fusobacterium sp. TaxID=159267 RepID=UPI0025F7D742|nr:helix-turn-helix transcriptional regulator [uncultured Fusobacterium sp.]
MDLKECLDKQLENEEFKKEWEEFQPELQLMKQVIGERIKQNISQKELADRMGTKQANISKLENGNANPSLDFLKRLANSLGKKLEIKFV